MKPPLKMWYENWNGGRTGVDVRNSGATRQGTGHTRACARVTLRNPPSAAEMVSNLPGKRQRRHGGRLWLRERRFD